MPVRCRRGYLLGTSLDRAQVEQFATEVLADPVQETFTIHEPGVEVAAQGRRISVLPLPGVTDPVAHSVEKAIRDSELPETAAGTYRVFELADNVAAQDLVAAAEDSLANLAIARVVADRVPQNMPGPFSAVGTINTNRSYPDPFVGSPEKEIGGLHRARWAAYENRHVIERLVELVEDDE